MLLSIQLGMEGQKIVLSQEQQTKLNKYFLFQVQFYNYQ